MVKGTNLAITLLPFIFLIHNIEEVLAIQYIDNTAFGSHITSIGQFIVAVLLFTILGFMVVFCKNFYRSTKQYDCAILGFAGMLFLNSFFPHILISALYRSYAPGLLSILTLVLPITSYILYQFYVSNRFSIKQIAVISLCGGIIGLLLAGVFLGIGYIFTYW